MSWALITGNGPPHALAFRCFTLKLFVDDLFAWFALPRFRRGFGNDNKQVEEFQNRGK